MKHQIAESPGPLSAHFPKEIKVHFGSLDDLTEDPPDAETELDVPEAEDEVPEAEDEVPEAEDEVPEAETDVVEDVIEDAEEDVPDAEDGETNASTFGDSEHPQIPEDVVLHYEDVVPVATSFSEMRKVNGVYVVPFYPIVVQTPVVVLREPLTRSAVLKVPGKFANFVRKLEGSVLEATKSHRSEWFKEDIDDDTIEEGFKSFLDGDVLRVKVDEDLASFDEHENLIDNDLEAPSGLRCILEASEISFGKSEFGVVFSMSQAQVAKPPKCKISKPRKSVEKSYFE